MNTLYQTFKLALYTNICKYLDFRETPYKIVEDAIYINNDTIRITIEEKGAYSELMVKDLNEGMEYGHIIDTVAYAIPTKGENSMFANDIERALASINENRERVKKEVVDDIVNKYKLKEQYEGYYLDTSSKIKLVITKNVRPFKFIIETNNLKNTFSVDPYERSKEEIINYIDSLVEIFFY